MSVQVHAILFGEEGIAIEYQDASDVSPFPKTVSIHVPFAVAEEHGQVAYDLNELMADALALVDSVKAARLSTKQPVREMGRT